MEDLYPEGLDCLFTMKGKILIYIKENRYRDPLLTSKDIQKEFCIAKTTASEYLSDLESLKLIERKQDGKRKYIYLTEIAD